MEEPISGLTSLEVQKRRQRGEGNAAQKPMTKTKGQILKDNIFTLFNLLNFIIAVLLFLAGAYTNMVFIAIVLLNIVIGIAQEWKAKKLVDDLSILNHPHMTVVRDGKEVLIETDEIVRDDIMVLESGRQICNDSVVVSGLAEVNESLLTGESDAIVKERGDELFSGSSVIAGKCYAKVTHVGASNYADRLAEEAKKEKQIESELLGSMKKVTRLTSFLIVPLGVFMFMESLYFRKASFSESVVSSSAALLGMLPKGLVLLISVSLAVGVIRLAKMKILVQNIYSLETLAHVDVLCLDKTGTITDGNMEVHTRIPLENAGEIRMKDEEAENMIRAYLAASDDNNATIQALRNEYPPAVSFKPVRKIPFSSGRKWGAVSFENIGTIFAAAPEKILQELPSKAKQEMEQGFRLVAFGYTKKMWTDTTALPEPGQILPLAVISMSDTIRKNTKEVLDYFRKEDVDVKIISGDHKKTVSMIAKEAGLTRWEDVLDMSELKGEIPYDDICQNYAVFARVTPKQKQELVRALKRQGHHVAMTGDGVNDLLALREADCSIAVAQGSDASRQISQIVLLESDFTHLPQVLLEGRKVINNVTRTAGVFFIKTIYSVLVSLFCLLMNQPFPFIPLQITLIDAAIEAYPSFLTVFESDTRKARGSFLKNAVKKALPFAMAVTGMIVLVTLLAPLSVAQKQTVMYLLLILITMAAVIKSCIPFTALRFFICGTMIIGTFGVLLMFPSLFNLQWLFL